MSELRGESMSYRVNFIKVKVPPSHCTHEEKRGKMCGEPIERIRRTRGVYKRPGKRYCPLGHEDWNRELDEKMVRKKRKEDFNGSHKR